MVITLSFPHLDRLNHCPAVTSKIHSPQRFVSLRIVTPSVLKYKNYMAYIGLDKVLIVEYNWN